MPSLPTFTVGNATADRLLAAFSGWTDEQGNPLTPVQAYRIWLRGSLISYVKAVEARKSRDDLEAQMPL